MTPGYLKCACEHCAGHIEFPVESVGQIANCPHCRLPTPLKLEVDGEDTVEVGGRRAKWVIAAVGACLFAVAALGAGLAYAKSLKNRKQAPVTQVASATATAAPAGGVPHHEWQKVRPAIGKFQGGFSANQIKDGRYTLGGACTECHKMYDPATFGDEWDRIVGGMRGKAKLGGREFEGLEQFVRSVRQ